METPAIRFFQKDREREIRYEITNWSTHERNVALELLEEIERLRSYKIHYDRLFEKSVVVPIDEYIENVKLRQKLALAEEALEFYRNGSSWTTNDDEFLFIKIADSDWMKSISGNFVGGMHACEALAKIRGAQC